MSKPEDYLSIVDHYEKCFEEHGDSHLGVDWPNEKDVLTRYRVMLELVSKDNKQKTLLDFGCGLSHFYDFIKKQNQKTIVYSGLDLSKKMIAASKIKYPHNKYYILDILKDNSLPVFDYIIMNGVFTEKLDLSYNEMFAFFKKMVKKIFSKVNIGLAFNTMSKHVDWERDDLFHLSFDELASFLTNEVSKDFIIRNDYGLYEYTTFVYNNQKDEYHG
jgi:SAM-dependent methyltransferase